MSSLPPLQPSTPANEWGSTTLNEIDERAKAEAASSGALLTAVPGQTPATPHTLPPTTGAAAVPAPVPMYDPMAASIPPATSTHEAVPATSGVPVASTIPPTSGVPSSGPILPVASARPATAVPIAGTIPSAGAIPPTTHATISTGPVAPPTHDPTVTSVDRYNEAGATAAPIAQTPGLDIPGSFPTSLAELQSTEAARQAQVALAVAQEKAAVGASVAADKATQGAQIAAQKASEGASVAYAAASQQFASALSSAAQYLPQSLKEKAAPYLPEGTSVTANASHHDTVHATSYPSTELRGAQAGESSGGVGALPGSALETGVAMPERLINPEPLPPTLAERAGAYVPDSVKQAAAPYLPAAVGATVSASEHDRTHPTSLPSNELTGAGTNEQVGGAGALPGTVTETGVAAPEALLDRPTGTVTQPTLAERAGAYVPESVKAYIPAGLAASVVGAGVVASEHDREHAASMPSAELTGAGTGERVGGAGALPGTVGESGVAVVPDERVGEQTPTLAGRIANARNAALGSAATAAAYVSHGTNQVRETVAPGSTVTTTAAAPHETMSLPTTETEGIRAGESTGGVGALPGSINETGVAVLPEEAGLTSSSHDSSSHTGTTSTTGNNYETPPTHNESHRSTEAAVLGTAAAATAVAADRHHDAADRHPVAADRHPVAGAASTTGTNYETPSGSNTHESHKPAEAAALGTAAAATAVGAERHHDATPAASSTPAPAAVNTPLPAATTEPATSTPAATTESTEHSGTKAAPTQMHDGGGTDHSSYGDDYHPSQLHPADADYSGVSLVDKPGEVHDKPTEGTLGASAAQAAGGKNDNDVAGLKEGGDRKLHGGVPGDIGGGTMPVGDKHEGGTDSLDLKNKAGQHDRASTSATDDSTASPTTGKPKFMDKLKGEMKILSGKIGHKPEKVEEGQRLKTGGAP